MTYESKNSVENAQKAGLDGGEVYRRQLYRIATRDDRLNYCSLPSTIHWRPAATAMGTFLTYRAVKKGK